MKKFKEWLWKTDEEGISNFDAITTAVVMFIAWGCVIIPLALR
jgi:hypothetical protein